MEELTIVQNKQLKQEMSKDTPTALELLIAGLNENHHFISFERQLYVYDEKYGYWRLIPASNSNYELRSIIPQNLKRLAMKVNFSSLYDWLLVDADQMPSNFFEEKRHWINFKDYAYNWKSDEMTTDRKKLNFRYALKIDLPKKKDHSSGAFTKFIDDVFDDEKTKKEFYKFLALCFGNIRSLKYCFFLYGPSNTGKSIILNFIKQILGEENCSSLSFSQFNNEFAVAQLLGKRVNLSGEVSGTTNKKLDVLKSISGNDMITASYKCKDHFQYQNTCMLIFACNCLPELPDYLDAQSFLSRTIIFPFCNPISREKWDKELLEKIFEDREGFMECLLSGFDLLKNDNYVINETKSMLAAKNTYSGIWESFSLFCDSFIVRDNNSKLPSSEIEHAYQCFCNQYDYVDLPTNQWTQVLKRNYGCQSCTVTTNRDGCKSRSRAYKGVAFAKNIDELLEKEKVKNNAVTDFQQNKFLPSRKK